MKSHCHPWIYEITRFRVNHTSPCKSAPHDRDNTSSRGAWCHEWSFFSEHSHQEDQAPSDDSAMNSDWLSIHLVTSFFLVAAMWLGSPLQIPSPNLEQTRTHTVTLRVSRRTWLCRDEFFAFSLKATASHNPFKSRDLVGLFTVTTLASF